MAQHLVGFSGPNMVIPEGTWGNTELPSKEILRSPLAEQKTAQTNQEENVARSPSYMPKRIAWYLADRPGTGTSTGLSPLRGNPSHTFKQVWGHTFKPGVGRLRHAQSTFAGLGRAGEADIPLHSLRELLQSPSSSSTPSSSLAVWWQHE